ncbi:MAG: hypothetical protein ACKO2K_12340 [Alphaproteobacteria bacterium]
MENRHVRPFRRALHGALLTAALAAAACTDPQAPAPSGAPAGKPAPPAAPARAVTTSARTPDEQQKAAMLEVLQAESQNDRQAWFLYSAGQDESAALAKSLAQIFESAGWKTKVRELRGMALKPGVSILAAEEEPPEWVGTVNEALGKGGLDPKYGTGYRAFYEEKKKENPAWPGIALGADELFVVAIGPAN